MDGNDLIPCVHLWKAIYLVWRVYAQGYGPVRSDVFTPRMGCVNLFVSVCSSSDGMPQLVGWIYVCVLKGESIMNLATTGAKVTGLGLCVFKIFNGLALFSSL